MFRFGVLDILMWTATCGLFLTFIVDPDPSTASLVVAAGLFVVGILSARARAENRWPVRSEVRRLVLTVVGLFAAAIIFGVIVIALILKFSG